MLILLVIFIKKLEKLNIKKNILALTVFSGLNFSISQVQSALVTHPLQYQRVTGTSETLSGTLIIDTSQTITFGSFLTDGGDLPSWINTLNFTYTDSSGNSQNFDKTDYAALRFVKNVDTVDYTNSDLKPQFTDISFLSKDSTSPSAGGGTAFQMDFDNVEFNLVNTPSPLPLLGFLPFIFAIKKIKRSIKL